MKTNIVVISTFDSFRVVLLSITTTYLFKKHSAPTLLVRHRMLCNAASAIVEKQNLVAYNMLTLRSSFPFIDWSIRRWKRVYPSFWGSALKKGIFEKPSMYFDFWWSYLQPQMGKITDQYECRLHLLYLISCAEKVY